MSDDPRKGTQQPNLELPSLKSLRRRKKRGTTGPDPAPETARPDAHAGPTLAPVAGTVLVVTVSP